MAMPMTRPLGVVDHESRFLTKLNLNKRYAPIRLSPNRWERIPIFNRSSVE
jgi:hypothetical protein